MQASVFNGQLVLAKGPAARTKLHGLQIFRGRQCPKQKKSIEGSFEYSVRLVAEPKTSLPEYRQVQDTFGRHIPCSETPGLC